MPRKPGSRSSVAASDSCAAATAAAWTAACSAAAQLAGLGQLDVEPLGGDVRSDWLRSAALRM